MTSAAITAAGTLATALADQRDPWHRRLALISAVEILSEVFDTHEDADTYNALTDFVSELRGQLFSDAQLVLDRGRHKAEADRHSGFSDVMRLWDESITKRREQDVRLGVRRAA